MGLTIENAQFFILLKAYIHLTKGSRFLTYPRLHHRECSNGTGSATLLTTVVLTAMSTRQVTRSACVCRLLSVFCFSVFMFME